MSASSSRPDASPVWLLTNAEMKRWDRDAVQESGIPERVLMESAGRAAATIVHRLYPRGPVVAAIGSGKNGGDALVALRCLRSWGREVLAVAAGENGSCAELSHGWEIPMASAGSEGAVYAGAGVILDGILGTGAQGPPRPRQAAEVRAIMSSSRPVVALDGPTGVDLSTGAAADGSISAEVTITFGAPKRGLLLFPGRAHAGRIIVAEVGFPPLARADAQVITRVWATARLPRLPLDRHKGTAGKVVVIAGHPGMGGAAIMAAMGALRAGAGGVRVVSHGANRVPVQTAVPEALFVDRAERGVAEVIASADALVVGPGMGTDARSRSLLEKVVEHARGPVLLDADAITMLAESPATLPRERADGFLLTPHPGEMSRLLGRETESITRDPFASAAEAVERFGCAVLLKGTPSIVAAPGEPVLVNVAGHAGLATGGMGDTLAGACGALLAAGCGPRDAAGCGLFFSGHAAEIAGRGRSLLPRDVAEALPDAIASEAGTPMEAGVLLDLHPAW